MRQGHYSIFSRPY